MFDKSKAMRSAERYLSQGKIRDAISEYLRVVDHDPRDIVTLNMLGDLHSKNADTSAAVRCYMSVADHYGEQGFSQKAIAVYNKISRLDPNSPEVTQKLAELYKIKGSFKEAKSHYETLAEHYNSQGRRIEALEIWTEIASLDPNNTQVYLTIADAYLQEERLEDAASAFCHGGERFLMHSLFAEAVTAFENALAIDPKYPEALKGFVDATIGGGSAEAAVERIQTMLADDPTNRTLLEQLVSVQLRAKDAAAAEKTLLSLVEVDPSCYLKCLDLADLFFENGDIDSSVRILTIASEHMLVGGQAGELEKHLERIDEAAPDRLDAVRLLARFCAWQKDDEYLRQTLLRLNEIAARDGSIDDERYALTQLVMIMPQEAAFSDRLRAINLELGIEDEVSANSYGRNAAVDNADLSNEHVIGNDDFAIVGIVSDSSEVVEDVSFDAPAALEPSVIERAGDVEVAEQDEFTKEVESIRFYIENGYNELAEKAIGELRVSYPGRPELDELLQMIRGAKTAETASNGFHSNGNGSNGKALFELGDLRSELGLEDLDASEDGDFETQFQTAVAYQEMGLMEQAISEFQDAAALVSVNDGTRRFFTCANLLGHCFMEMGKANLAAKWHLRSLESLEINSDERQGVWYELGLAYEAAGDHETASKYFEQVYVENIDFRDISQRMKNMAVPA